MGGVADKSVGGRSGWHCGVVLVGCKTGCGVALYIWCGSAGGLNPMDSIDKYAPANADMSGPAPIFLLPHQGSPYTPYKCVLGIICCRRKQGTVGGGCCLHWSDNGARTVVSHE